MNIEFRKSHLRVLSTVLSNVSSGLLILPITVSISTGNLNLGSLTISLILAIIYYGFAVKVENFLEAL